MSLSSCDIGNPIYEKTPPMQKDQIGSIKNVCLFDKNDSEIYCDLFYTFTETPEGIDIEVDIDLSNHYTLEELPNHEEDIRAAIAQEIRKPIFKLLIF